VKPGISSLMILALTCPHTILSYLSVCLVSLPALVNSLGCVTIDGVCIGGWIINQLHTPLGTTSTNNSIAKLHTLQITTAPTKSFSSLLCLQQPFPSNGF
jgi:hypothetical protein